MRQADAMGRIDSFEVVVSKPKVILSTHTTLF